MRALRQRVFSNLLKPPSRLNIQVLTERRTYRLFSSSIFKPVTCVCGLRYPRRPPTTPTPTLSLWSCCCPPVQRFSREPVAGQFVADFHGPCSTTTEGQLIILRPPPPGTISESASQFCTGLWELLCWKRLASPTGNWGSWKFFQGANYKVFVYPDE